MLRHLGFTQASVNPSLSCFGQDMAGMPPHMPQVIFCMQVLISKDKHVAGRVREHVEGLEAEVNVLRRLDHPNIVRYLVSHLRRCSKMQADSAHGSMHVKQLWKGTGCPELLWALESLNFVAECRMA